jgi:sugar/nucleoside kinase (ribokinase family)
VNDLVPVDYLVVGHVSRDVKGDGYVAGGTVVYSALAAQAMGCRTAVLTSTSPDYDLTDLFPGISIRNIPAQQSTTYKNTYHQGRRQQQILGVAAKITAENVPYEWRRASIVHLGPIANEIESDLIDLFTNSLVGLTPQGWYREWDERGRISSHEWSGATKVMPLAAAVIISMEDLPDKATFDRVLQLSPLVVLTQQAGGCTIFFRGESRQIPAPVVTEVNPTGAGDIFATAFLVRLHQTKGNPWEAGDFANRVAACSVANDSLDSKLQAIKEIIGQET